MTPEEKVNAVLMHHGIEGQKWGIKHGPPYPLDKKTSNVIKDSGKITINIKSLSDDDLKRIRDRLQMEKQVKDLTREESRKAETYVQKSLRNLRDKATNTLFDTVLSVMSDSIKTVIKFTLNQALKDSVKDKQ